LALIQAVAGRYVGTFDGHDIGLLSEAGYEISWESKGFLINRTDTYADTLIDGLMTGSDWRLRFLCIEYGETPSNVVWPWGRADPTKVMYPTLGTVETDTEDADLSIGHRWLDIGKATILTATPGTPAADNPGPGPISMTAKKSIVSPNTPVVTRLAPQNRTLPAELLMLPFVSEVVDNNIVWFDAV
jgi:hypothetical protein